MSDQKIAMATSLTVLAGAALCMSLAAADEMVSLATGGYARGLRKISEMHKIDTDGDGNVSKAEWLAYQEKVFAALDKDKTGTVDEKEFLTPSSEMATLATGGYGRHLSDEGVRHDGQESQRQPGAAGISR